MKNWNWKEMDTLFSSESKQMILFWKESNYFLFFLLVKMHLIQYNRERNQKLFCFQLGKKAALRHTCISSDLENYYDTLNYLFDQFLSFCLKNLHLLAFKREFLSEAIFSCDRWAYYDMEKHIGNAISK